MLFWASARQILLSTIHLQTCCKIWKTRSCGWAPDLLLSAFCYSSSSDHQSQFCSCLQPEQDVLWHFQV